MCEYIYVLYSHLKHKALEMCAAEIKKPMHCLAEGLGCTDAIGRFGQGPQPSCHPPPPKHQPIQQLCVWRQAPQGSKPGQQTPFS